MTLPNMADKVKYVQFLHDASEIGFRPNRQEGYQQDLLVRLPVVKPNVEIPVIELFLKQ